MNIRKFISNLCDFEMISLKGDCYGDSYNKLALRGPTPTFDICKRGKSNVKRKHMQLLSWLMGFWIITFQQRSFAARATIICCQRSFVATLQQSFVAKGIGI